MLKYDKGKINVSPPSARLEHECQISLLYFPIEILARIGEI